MLGKMMLGKVPGIGSAPGLFETRRERTSASPPATARLGLSGISGQSLATLDPLAIEPVSIERELLRARFQQALSRASSGLGSGTGLSVGLASTAATRNATAASRRTRELAWRRDHLELLRAHAGQWVVLESDQLVAHGPDPAALVAEARTRGIRVPYVFFVDARADDVVSLGL